MRTLTGDLRGRGDGRQVVDLETSDAGALFRFTDVYSRMTGGQMSIVDGPAVAPDNPAQQGTLSVRNFAVHDEAQLERAVSERHAADPPQRYRFLRHARRIHPHAGPRCAARRRGARAAARRHHRRRGRLRARRGAHARHAGAALRRQQSARAIAAGRACSWAARRKAWSASPTKSSASPGKPVLRINPISALAPGLLRKVFEFPANSPCTGRRCDAAADNATTIGSR